MAWMTDLLRNYKPPQKKYGEKNELRGEDREV